MECQFANTSCADGRGICGNASMECICMYPYTSRADFSRHSKCGIDFVATIVLWGITTFIWTVNVIRCIMAFAVLKRKTYEAQVYEILSLSLVSTTSVLMCLIGYFEVTTSSPGLRSIGLDPLTTILFCIGNTTNWIFIIMSPLNKSGNGVSPFAMERTKMIRSFYVKLFPILVISVIVGSWLPLGVLSTDEERMEQQLKMSFYLLLGINMIITAGSISITLYSVRKDLLHALKHSAQQDPGQHASQRKTSLERLVRRTNKLMMISGTGALLVGPLLVLTGLVPTLFDFGWIFFPLVLALSGLWTLRYLVASVILSYAARKADNDQQESNSRGKRPPFNSKDPRIQQNKNGDTSTTATQETTESNNTKKRKRVRFRLKGIKPKPLQQMTIVQEGENEGTVLVTHVPGMDEPN